MFPAPPHKYAYENHKKHSAPGKIYYGIKYMFCVDTFNENAYRHFY